ncbi:MAG: hypothetical protein NZ873_01855 [Crenarchaeota archaeon]|nr:hypothetical protein [Thermoproteota archaeon]MDW8033901.1 hypothetical protein [Nitrososphaerota archaeon]
MVTLFDRELKFVFTSPLFISLELVPAILSIAVQNIIPSKLLPIVWLMIIFYSTYFELELWRKSFLKKNIKLMVYTSSSPYTPFLIHCIVSLLLLELKTLIFILPYLNLQNLSIFLTATHVNWLFSLSLGTILSRDVFNDMADSTANFLCILVFSTIALLIINSTTADSQVSFSLKSYWPIPSVNSADINIINNIIAVFLISTILFAIAIYANSMVTKRLLLGGY